MIWAVLMAVLLSDSLTTPAVDLNTPTFLQTLRIIHTPPDIIFRGRPYDLTCFVEFPEDSIRAVTLFIKSNTMAAYREIPLEGNLNLYSFRFYDFQFPGDTLSYFFTVELKEKLLAMPINDAGKIQPVIRAYIDARDYYQIKPK